MSGSFLLFLLVVVAVVSASKRADWELVREAAHGDPVDFHLALERDDTSAFDTAFDAITTPGSPRYGHYLTRDQVLDMVAPAPSVSAGVVAHVKRVCPRAEVRNLRDAVHVTTDAACAGRLLGVRLGVYRHKARAALHCVRLLAGRPAVAPALRVAHVMGLGLFPVLRKKKVRNTLATEVYDFVSASTINQRYNITSNTITSAGSKWPISLVEFPGESAPLFTDLQQYDRMSGVPFMNISRIVGPFVQSGNDGESLLDVQLASAVAQTPLAYISVSNGWIYSMAQTIFHLDNPPLVQSVSYGWPEALSCDFGLNCSSHDVEAYIARSEMEMKKLGALGITVVVCSQDEGAPSEHNANCLLDLVGKPLWPVYPGSSSYALSVSGTTLMSASGSVPPSSLPICKAVRLSSLRFPSLTRPTQLRVTRAPPTGPLRSRARSTTRISRGPPVVASQLTSRNPRTRPRPCRSISRAAPPFPRNATSMPTPACTPTLVLWAPACSWFPAAE